MQTARASNLMFQTTRALTPSERKSIRDQWEAVYSGTCGGSVVVLSEGESVGQVIPPIAPVFTKSHAERIRESVKSLERHRDCKFCGSSGEPDKSGNCRGCGARRT